MYLTGPHQRTWNVRIIPSGARLASALSDLLDADMQLASKERSQSCAVSVADARGDLLYARMAGLEQMHGTLDAQALEIRQRRLAEDIVHAARERSLAGADGLRGLVERKAARQPASRPA